MWIAAKELKGKLGTGDTLKGGQIELQGEHRQALWALLPGRGLQVKA